MIQARDAKETLERFLSKKSFIEKLDFKWIFLGVAMFSLGTLQKIYDFHHQHSPFLHYDPSSFPDGLILNGVGLVGWHILDGAQKYFELD